MSRDEIVEHGRYLSDTVKLSAYSSALDALVGPDTVVLDLGAGSGILGLLAARAGARTVYSVDNGSIIAVTEAIARANGLADRMVFVQRTSTDLTLPEPVDLVVGDQIGGLVYDAGVLEFYADARKRLLAPGGRLVPGSFRLLAAPVSALAWDTTVGVWADGPAGFDLGPMLDLAANTEFRVECGSDDLLGPAVTFATVDADHIDPITASVELTVERPGRLNGVLGMFVAELAPGIRLTNEPGRPDTFSRWQNLYPLRAATEVEPGDVVTVGFDLRPTTCLATWTIEVRRRGGAGTVRHRGSTVLGSFLTPTDLAVTTGTARPRADRRLGADLAILDLVDGERTINEIAATVWAAHRDQFHSVADAEGRIVHLLWRYLRAELPWPDSSTA